MTRYQVDSDAVLTATGAVRSAIGQLQNAAAGLNGHLATLQSSWTGSAAAAFGATVTDWNSTQLQVEESLAAINQSLSLAGQQYADIESANARLFGR
jgi:early secretory antigenic target protein ESAT-6